MKRVQLKRIPEFLWKGNSSEEKTPIANSAVTEHGSISKDFPADGKGKFDESQSEKSDELEGPMSILRKICFVMSFNVWILYFLVFGWLIPCQNLRCDFPFNDAWERNLTSVWPLTNLETLNAKGLPSLAMYGYVDGKFLHLAGMEMGSGNTQWNKSLSFIPRKIQCNFEIDFDSNGDGVADCLLTGYNDVYAFNASNGHVFWEQNLPSDEGNIVSRYHPTLTHDGVSFLIGTCGDKLVILNAQTGAKYSEVKLPCSAPFDIRIIPNVVDKNFTLWNIVCDYGDKVESWAFAEEDMLRGRISNTTTSFSEFALLFSDSNSGSIDLGSDVTPIPGGPLLLSWSDRVVMVTSNGTAWEKSFPYPVSVASIAIGHFTDIKNLQAAVAARNGTNTIIYILEIGNGTMVNSLLLEDRQAQSLQRIVGDIDTLLLKSLSTNFTSIPVYPFTDPTPRDQTNFALVEFIDKKLSFKDIVTTGLVMGSSLNVNTDGEVDLLLIKSEEKEVTFQKYVIYRSPALESALCGGKEGSHTSHFSYEI